MSGLRRGKFVKFVKPKALTDEGASGFVKFVKPKALTDEGASGFVKFIKVGKGNGCGML